MSKALTIMLVKNRALGDSVMGLSTVQYVKHLYPKANIIYAVPQWIAPLYKETVTAADRIYPLRLNHFLDILKLGADLKKLKIDHIHEMHQSGRGGKILKWLALLLGIRYTAHNHHLKMGSEVVDQGVIKPLIQRDLDGIYSYLGKGEKPHYLNFPPQIKLTNIQTKLPTIIFGVVATRKTKQWPLENYLKLASLIHARFPKFSIIIPLSKSLEDEKIKKQLHHLGLPANVSIVEWELSLLPSAFAQASIYIGNDTGLKHLAVAVGVKTHTFFGPEPTQEWHPYDPILHPYFYHEALACRTRTSHYCGLAVCDLNDDHMFCLTYFKPQTVYEKVSIDLESFSFS